MTEAAADQPKDPSSTENSTTSADYAVKQIYDQLNGLFGGQSQRQIFTMTFPTQPLNFRDYLYDCDGEFGALKKPASVAEAEFRLADEMFDPATIVAANNGYKLSVVMQQVLDNFVPKMDDLTEYLADRARLSAFFNKPIEVGGRTTTRIDLYREAMEKYVDARADWVTEKTTKLRNAHLPSEFQDFSEWVSSIAPAKQLGVDVHYYQAVLQGYLHETMAILGYLNAATPAESLEHAKQAMRHSAHSSVDESMTVYPIRMQPSNWAQAMFPNLNPEDLTQNIDAIMANRDVVTAQLDQAELELNRLMQINISPEQLAKLVTAASDAQATWEQKRDEVIKTQGRAAVDIAKRYIDMQKTKFASGADLVLNHAGNALTTEESAKKEFGKALTDPDMRGMLGIDSDTHKKGLIEAVGKAIAATQEAQTAATSALREATEAKRLAEEAKTRDFQLELAQAESLVKRLIRDKSALDSKLVDVHRARKNKGASAIQRQLDDLSGQTSVSNYQIRRVFSSIIAVLTDAKKTDAEIGTYVESGENSLTALLKTETKDTSIQITYKWLQEEVAKLTPADEAEDESKDAIRIPTVTGTTTSTTNVKNSEIFSACKNWAIKNNFEQEEEAFALPATRPRSSADAMWQEVIIKFTHEEVSNSSSKASSADQSGYSVSFGFGSLSKSSSSSSAMESASTAMQNSNVEIGLRVAKVSFDRGGWFQPNVLANTSGFYSLGRQENAPLSGLIVSGGATKEAITNSAKVLKTKKEKLTETQSKLTQKMSETVKEEAEIEELELEVMKLKEEINAIENTDYGLLPSYTTAMIVAKDMVFKITAASQKTGEDTKSSSSSSSVSGGFLCFSGHHSHSDHSESKHSYSSTSGRSTVIRIPGPHIIGYVQELVPLDVSSPYVAFDARDKDVTMTEVLRLFDQAVSGELAKQDDEAEMITSPSARPSLVAHGLDAAE